MANPQSAAFKEGFIQTNGHGRMHYHEAGPVGNGAETLILIHTNGGSAYQYAGTLATLSKKFRVIAWEMPGHGDSDPLPRHYTIEDYCAALAAFTQSLVMSGRFNLRISLPMNNWQASLSLLTGIAAVESIKRNQPVNISELVPLRPEARRLSELV